VLNHCATNDETPKRNNMVEFVEYDDAPTYEEHVDAHHTVVDTTDADTAAEAAPYEGLVTYLDTLSGDMQHILDDYNHIIIHHYNEEFAAIYELIMSHYQYRCDVKQCRAMLRNHRCRETQNLLASAEDSSIKFSTDNLVTIDLMDAIHCHLFHSFDIGYMLDPLQVVDDQDCDDQKTNEGTDINAPATVDYSQIRPFVLKKRELLLTLRSSTHRLQNNKFRIETSEMKQKLTAEEQRCNKVVDVGALNVDNIYMVDQNVFHVGRDIASKLAEAVTADTLLSAPKYKDLKAEVLNNGIYGITFHEYTQIIVKAQKKLSCEIARSLTSDEHGPLLAEHIVVVILYCDYDILRNAYCRIVQEYPMVDTAKLHELFNFHTGLQHTVRTYGINLRDVKSSFYLKQIRRFYVSCSSPVVFPGVNCQFYNATSMSANMAPVALYNDDGRADNRGVILELGPRENDAMVKYFTCSWISAFGGEDERIFLNDQQHCGSLRLHNISFIGTGGRSSISSSSSSSAKQSDLRLFLEALSCFDGCLQEGWKSTSTKPVHFKIISALMQQRRREHNEHTTDVVVDEMCAYEYSIFNAFCNHKLKIDILVQNLRGPFCKILFDDADGNNTSYTSVCAQLIRFDVLCDLFQNCKVIKTWYVGNEDYNQHSGITNQWIAKLYKMLDAVNGVHDSKLSRIVINNNHRRVQPIVSASDIDGICASKFMGKGWQITHNECSEDMDEIILNKTIVWNDICIESFDMQKSCYLVRTDVLAQRNILMSYKDFRNIFEEISKKLSHSISVEKADIKELKKMFPSKVIFKKQNDEKVMKMRQEKLNEYFAKLIEFANHHSQMTVKMGINATLTHYLVK